MTESPIFVKLFDLVAWLIPLSVKFPREQRFVVASALQRAALAAHEDLIRAGHAKEPATILRRLDDVAAQLALIRFYVRLSERLTLITVKQYEYSCERLAEVSRLLAAWQRSCRAKQTATGAADRSPAAASL